MTIDELRDIISDLEIKSEALTNAASNLQSLVAEVKRFITPANPYASTIDIDALVAINTPLYLNRIAAIEAAADALGTDN